MKSILAYKRFKKQAREKFERDRKRTDQLDRGNSKNNNIGDTETEKIGHRPSSIKDNSSNTGTPSHAHSPDSRDPEKGEQPGREEKNGHQSSPQDQDGLQRNNTHSTIRTNQSFVTRMGNAMTGTEVRELSKQITKGRSRAATRTNTNPNTSKEPPAREKVFVSVLPLPQAAEDFGVSEVTESLVTGLFLIGFGAGALFAGPTSETLGRNPVYIVTMAIYMIWIMSSALAPNLSSQLMFRFLAGFFGNPMERVYAFPVFANAAFMGPIFGPVVGGFIGQSSLVSWRWCEWITLILSGLILTLIITEDERYVAEIEIRADPFWKQLTHALYRPFVLTVREPIIILCTLYLKVVYIILFIFLDGYACIFGDTYGFSEGITMLAFLGIAVGLCFASLLVPLIHKWAKRDLVQAQASHGPNARLTPAKRLCYQYIIGSYEIYAASTLASLTLIRYVAAGGMTVVGIPFYKNMGVPWTLIILSCISASIVPVPYISYYYGPKIRSWSKYAPNKDDE
ncbi:major facilitator superfamily domain-containing protein [Rhexocercosporidium sp. MPI-PUGE-AT-0058]|nr:major facilitator superfamily domain-containing protein [Rhexocercosporidium sp. MPI-PUGE-AT-0058]